MQDQADRRVPAVLIAGRGERGDRVVGQRRDDERGRRGVADAERRGPLASLVALRRRGLPRDDPPRRGLQARRGLAPDPSLAGIALRPPDERAPRRARRAGVQQRRLLRDREREAEPEDRGAFRRSVPPDPPREGERPLGQEVEEVVGVGLAQARGHRGLLELEGRRPVPLLLREADEEQAHGGSSAEVEGEILSALVAVGEGVGGRRKHEQGASSFAAGQARGLFVFFFFVLSRGWTFFSFFLSPSPSLSLSLSLSTTLKKTKELTMLEAIERAMAASCGGGSETWLMTCFYLEGKIFFQRVEVQIGEVPMLDSFEQKASSASKPAGFSSSYLIEGLPRGRSLDGLDERGHRQRGARQLSSHGCRDSRRRRRSGCSPDALWRLNRRRGEGRRRVLRRRRDEAKDRGGAASDGRGASGAQQSRAGGPCERRH